MTTSENTVNNIIYISNFPKKLPKEVLETTLKEYGVLLSLNIIYKHDFSFAFAQFDDIRDAAFAVKELNQKLYHGMNLKVQYKNKKAEEKKLQIEEIIKKETSKSSQSPNTTLETTCSILPSKIAEPVKNTDKSISHNPQQSRRRKNSRQQIQSNFSIQRPNQRLRQKERERSRERQRQRQRQRSRSRSRRKNIRRERYDDWLSYSHEEQSRDRQKSFEKYQNRMFQHRDNSRGGEVVKMYEMVRKMGKNLRRLQERLQVFLLKPNYDYREEGRRRN